MSKVYFVGAGSGDVGLLSVKGLQALKQADVVLFDRLVNPLLLYFTKSTATLLDVGKSPQKHQKTQREIEAMLVEEYLKGKTVLRLKGGDPAIFGRVGEEIFRLREKKIPFEVIPGITAASAASIYAEIPLTQRGVAERVLLLTPRQEMVDLAQTDFKKIVQDTTIVVYMGVASIPELSALLKKQGVSPELPIALIENGTRGIQRTVVTTLKAFKEIAEKKRMKNPALIVLGQAVSLRQENSWFEELPRFGESILLVQRTLPTMEEILTLTNQGADLWVTVLGKNRALRFDLLDGENLKRNFSEIIFKDGTTMEELERIKGEKNESSRINRSRKSNSSEK